MSKVEWGFQIYKIMPSTDRAFPLRYNLVPESEVFPIRGNAQTKMKELLEHDNNHRYTILEVWEAK